MAPSSAPIQRPRSAGSAPGPGPRRGPRSPGRIPGRIRRVRRSTACTTASAFLARWSTSRISRACRSSASLRAVIVHMDAEDRPHRPAGAGHAAAAADQPADFLAAIAAGAKDAELRLVLAGLQRPAGAVPHAVPVIGMHQGEEAFQSQRRRGRGRRRRTGAVLRRPEEASRLRVPFPGADAGDFLRQPQPGLAGAQGCLGCLQRGGIGMHLDHHAGRLATAGSRRRIQCAATTTGCAAAPAVAQFALPLAGPAQAFLHRPQPPSGKAGAEQFMRRGPAPPRRRSRTGVSQPADQCRMVPSGARSSTAPRSKEPSSSAIASSRSWRPALACARVAVRPRPCRCAAMPTAAATTISAASQRMGEPSGNCPASIENVRLPETSSGQNKFIAISDAFAETAIITITIVRRIWTSAELAPEAGTTQDRSGSMPDRRQLPHDRPPAGTEAGVLALR